MDTTKLFKRYRYSLILLRELVITDFKLRYQGSMLGYLWALLRPMFLFVILYVVFVYILKIGTEIPHWPIALLLGIVMWNFFNEVTKQGLKAIVGSGGMIRKINFPKYVIVIAASVSALINLFINLIVVGIFMVINQVVPSWEMLLVFFFIIELYFFALGVAFILSTVYVKFRDINYIWEIITQGLFYGSAIMFPLTRVVQESELAAQILLLNPAAQAINDARVVVVTHDFPTLHSLSDSFLLAIAPYIIVIAVFIIGAHYFRVRSPKFAEEI